MAFIFGVIPMLLLAPIALPLNALLEFLNWIAPFIADL